MHATHFGAATPDAPSAPVLAAVVGQRSQADELGGPASIEPPQPGTQTQHMVWLGTEPT